VTRTQSFLTAGLLAAALCAVSSSVYARQLTLAEAQALAARSADGSEIPITVNELVLAKLNDLLGSAQSVQSIRDGISRMPGYREMIDGRLREYGLPEDLLAIPLLESRYRNDVVSTPLGAAGLWQFLAATARRYHLVVTDGLDERLDPAKETEAAAQYFRDLEDQFQDWRLALKAYNEGENRVQALIQQYGTRDPWALERQSSTEGYLPAAMAMILISRNPSLAD
jgi:hypothetical protein